MPVNRVTTYQGSAAPLRLLPHDLHLERRSASSSSPTSWASRRWARVPATANTSRWITTSTFQIPGEALKPRGRRVRNPRHRGTARGLLSRSDSAARAGSSGGRTDRHQREIQIAAVSRVPAVRRAAARLSRRGPRSARRRRARRARCSAIASIPIRFRRDQTGVAEMHHLDLDFGNAARGNHAVLILNGWVDWADGSTFLSRHAGARGPDVPLPAGEGCGRQLEDRRRGHGNPGGQAEDHRGGSDRQVSLRLARSPHRHQSLRLLGRDLPDREQRAAASRV